MTLSPKTKAILLLTAPLIVGRAFQAGDILSAAEYQRLRHQLSTQAAEPVDLLGPQADGLIEGCSTIVDKARLQRLLQRGFQLSEAVERWHSRNIWVVSHADEAYPRCLLRLDVALPPVLYGCGDITIADTGGLAVVGSRDADTEALDYASSVGRLAGRARVTLISGGARGVDRAAMRGALEVDGNAVGVLADGLEKGAMNREDRQLLLDGRLVLLSPFDPSAGFNVGNAMGRNKVIYALSDAALVVSSDFEKGGTWAGAIEQLEKLRLVPVYTRSRGRANKGLEALRARGAMRWPNPSDALELTSLVRNQALSAALIGQENPADWRQRLLGVLSSPKSPAQVSQELGVSAKQAGDWLKCLVQEEAVERKGATKFVVRPRRLFDVVPAAEDLLTATHP